MDYDKLKEMGLSDVQINQVISEHNRAKGDSPLSRDEQLEKRRKRDEIMAVRDTETRQRLIQDNAELFR